MFVWRQWVTKTFVCGKVKSQKSYRMLLLFGLIPLFIYIDG